MIFDDEGVKVECLMPGVARFGEERVAVLRGEDGGERKAWAVPLKAIAATWTRRHEVDQDIVQDDGD